MRHKLVFIGTFLLCFPVLFPCVVWVAFLRVPREYYSSVIVENTMPARFSDEHYGNPDFQILKSKELLYAVIDELGLVNKWSERGQIPTRELTYSKLLKNMKVSKEQGTNFVEIGVYSPDAEEAALIANDIVMQYKSRLHAEQAGIIEGHTSDLRDEVKKLEQRLEEAGAVLQKIREDSSMDVNPENELPAEQDEKLKEEEKSKAVYLNAKKNYIDTKKALDAAEQRLTFESIPADIQLVVWARAVPAKFPSRPDISRAMKIACGIGCPFAIFGAALVFLGLRGRSNKSSSL